MFVTSLITRIRLEIPLIRIMLLLSYVLLVLLFGYCDTSFWATVTHTHTAHDDTARVVVGIRVIRGFGVRRHEPHPPSDVLLRLLYQWIGFGDVAGKARSAFGGFDWKGCVLFLGQKNT